MSDKYAIQMPLGDFREHGIHVSLEQIVDTNPVLVMSSTGPGARDRLLRWLMDMEKQFHQAAVKAANL